MRILVVAATEFEVDSLKPEIRNTSPDTIFKNLDFDLLITGAGMVATAFALGRRLALNQYDLVINLGIAGSFDKETQLGDIFEITEDTFAELGAEDDTEFIPINELGFGECVYYPTTKISNLYNLFNNFNLKQARAITINKVHGNESTIEKIRDRLNPQLESMEGAAFFYACREMKVPCLQIRAVSNYVEKRNRDNWQIGLAIKNLNNFAVEFLKLYA